ncbi:MAG: ice-binding family protein [Actinomycetota bacterium]
MKFPRYVRNASRVRFGVASVAAVGLLVALPFSAQAAQPPVGLGTATSYAILAGTTVTNTGNSTISGDLGVSPGSVAPFVTGFPPGVVNPPASQHVVDAVALQAQADLTTAYVNAAGRTPVSAIPVELGGQKLKPGVYSGGALKLTGTLTLDAGGDASAVFIFKAASTLITGAGSRVNLINGASSCNVFWQITSSATIGAGSTFRGTVMALTSISLNAGATVDGRMLARNGAVTLINNTIRTSPCAIGAAVPTATPTPQVKKVPIGAVETGDGSTSGGGNDSQGFLAGAMLFAGVGGAAVVAVRRRRRLNA